MKAYTALLAGVVSSALTYLFWPLPELPCGKVCMHAVSFTWSSDSKADNEVFISLPGKDINQYGLHMYAMSPDIPVPYICQR